MIKTIDLSSLIILSSCLLTILALLIYIRFNFSPLIIVLLVSAGFSCVLHTNLVTYLVNNGDILEYPHLFRTGSLSFLSTFPLFYLVVEKIFFKVGLKWLDLLHFIPLVLICINFLSFFILSDHQKVEIIEKLYLQNQIYDFAEGSYLSGTNFILFCFLLVACYTYMVGNVVIKIRNGKVPALSQKMFINWLFLYCFVMLLFLFLLLLTRSFNFIAFDMISFFPFFSLIAIIFFFLHPNILYGSFKEDASVDDQLSTALFEEETQLSLKQKNNLKFIEKHLAETGCYLQENFSLMQLEKETKISAKQISICIKLAYGKNFNRFINEKRISFVQEKLKNDKLWRGYSNEMIAYNSGFNSPNSFYGSFKEIVGKTPRQYIDESYFN